MCLRDISRALLEHVDARGNSDASSVLSVPYESAGNRGASAASNGNAVSIPWLVL